MSFILLRRTLTAAPPGATSPFRALCDYFDTDLRKPYHTLLDSQVNDPFELPQDYEVHEYEYKPGFTRGVFYNGAGSVYTKNLGGVAISTLSLKADTTAPRTEASDSADASVDLTGHQGQPPYELTLVGTVGSNSVGYRQTAVSPSESYPARFRNLKQGEYAALVKDARGSLASGTINVLPGTGKARGPLLLQASQGPIYNLKIWRLNNLDVKYYPSFEPGRPDDYQIPSGQYVDGFLLPGSAGNTWRQVYSDGKGDVYFQDISTARTSTLELDNLILFHPNRPDGVGGFVVEMNATALPLTFTCGAKSNSDGRFDGIWQGDCEVVVTDAIGATLTVPIKLTCRYGLWLALDFSDLSGTPARVELWLQDYAGEVGALVGDADPVVLKSDGLNGGTGGQGDVPAVVGTSCELRLRMPADTFEAVLIGPEFLCRADVYYDGQLEFRGYVQPALSNQPLLAGAQALTLTATDGLAQLADVAFTGHQGQRLYGHRPILHNILHCLSRTGIARPLAIFVNRRDATMADDDAPELAATTNRTGYWDEGKNEPENQRAALEGLVQALGGTLCQRGGEWQIRSALEAKAEAPGRLYSLAGATAAAVTAPAPGFAIVPPRNPAAAGLRWLKGQQMKQVRAGWKSLTGQTDAGYLKNAFPAGAVFSDKNAWLPDLSQLRPLAGWQPAAGASFPLVFTRAGEKGSDYATLWPRSANSSSGDGRALESPLLPLAAGTEAVPAVLIFSGKVAPTEYYLDTAGAALGSPTTAKKAFLAYEVRVDGQSTGQQLAELTAVASSAAKDVSFEAKLPPLPSTAGGAVLRVYAWWAADTNLLSTAPKIDSYSSDTYPQGTVVRYEVGLGSGVFRLFVARQDGAPASAFALGPDGPNKAVFYEIPATNIATGQLLLSSVAVQLRPQQATWEGADNFRADGPAGTVRPTEALKVYHPDPPLSAGLFGGNLFAFGRGVGLSDGTQPTSWARKIDLKPAPLLEANVLDGLALRAGASRLLTGPLRLGTAPVRLLDSLDTPYDVPGRRFMAGATEWSLKHQRSDVSLIEIGPGANAPAPVLPEGARITHGLYEYAPGQFAPRVRLTHNGRVRLRHR